jgi:mannitol-1-phosphate 5-dehydrogenase
VPADPESVELQEMLRTHTAPAFVHDVTGIPAGHPLESGLVAAVVAAQTA